MPLSTGGMPVLNWYFTWCSLIVASSFFLLMAFKVLKKLK